MQDFAYLLTVVWNILFTPFTLFGFTLSLGEVFAYTTVGGILFWMVVEVLDV